MPPGIIDPNAPTPAPMVPLGPPVQIILTAEEADQVRGLSVEGSALAPSPLNDGTFSLPMSVLDDPAHAAHKDFLKALTNPPREVEPTESLGYKASREDVLAPEIMAALDACSYKTDWVVAEPVAVDKTVMATAVAVAESQIATIN